MVYYHSKLSFLKEAFTHVSMIFYRYIVKDVLGHGTFGQVAKCWVPDTSSFVAVKIIKNQPAYHQQALVEVSILTTVIKFSYSCMYPSFRNTSSETSLCLLHCLPSAVKQKV